MIMGTATLTSHPRTEIADRLTVGAPDEWRLGYLVSVLSGCSPALGRNLAHEYADDDPLTTVARCLSHTLHRRKAAVATALR